MTFRVLVSLILIAAPGCRTTSPAPTPAGPLGAPTGAVNKAGNDQDPEKAPKLKSVSVSAFTYNEETLASVTIEADPSVNTIKWEACPNLSETNSKAERKDCKSGVLTFTRTAVLAELNEGLQTITFQACTHANGQIELSCGPALEKSFFQPARKNKQAIAMIQERQSKVAEVRKDGLKIYDLYKTFGAAKKQCKDPKLSRIISDDTLKKIYKAGPEAFAVALIDPDAIIVFGEEGNMILVPPTVSQAASGGTSGPGGSGSTDSGKKKRVPSKDPDRNDDDEYARMTFAGMGIVAAGYIGKWFVKDALTRLQQEMSISRGLAAGAPRPAAAPGAPAANGNADPRAAALANNQRNLLNLNVTFKGILIGGIVVASLGAMVYASKNGGFEILANSLEDTFTLVDLSPCEQARAAVSSILALSKKVSLLAGEARLLEEKINSTFIQRP